MEIVPLVDHPEMIPKLAGWFHREWHEASATHDPLDRLTRFSTRREIPQALVAVDRSEPIGTVSLLPESVHSHPHLAPWVAGLYVVPEWRHRGVATPMITAAVREARLLCVTTVYIGITTARDFYERTGWVYQGQGISGEDLELLNDAIEEHLPHIELEPVADCLISA